MFWRVLLYTLSTLSVPIDRKINKCDEWRSLYGRDECYENVRVDFLKQLKCIAFPRRITFTQHITFPQYSLVHFSRVSTYMKKYQNWSTPSYTCDINDNNLVVPV